MGTPAISCLERASNSKIMEGDRGRKAFAAQLAAEPVRIADQPKPPAPAQPRPSAPAQPKPAAVAPQPAAVVEAVERQRAIDRVPGI
jgi:hypothetical protein